MEHMTPNRTASTEHGTAPGEGGALSAEMLASGLIGPSAAMETLRRMIRRLAPVATTVLINGESGTGKEVVARALHTLSPRAEAPFLPVNCGAVSPELMESEFFGHVKGAFTGAHDRHDGLFFAAQGGTLFLDEIGELPLPMQAKLLRVLEDRRLRPVGGEREIPVDVRIVAATNRDLAAEVAAGRFRQDLYYRLNVITLDVPPLRRRLEDVPMLARWFAAQIAERLGLPSGHLEDAEVLQLMRLSWPGNVRELRNLVERRLVMGEWPEDIFAGAAPAAPADEARDQSLAAVEKRHILGVLESTGGNRTRAAQLLGVSRRTLERRMNEWAQDPAAGD